MAVTVQFYNNFMEDVGKGVINLLTDTFKIILVDSGYSFDAADDGYSDVSADELATAFGYTQATKELGSVTWVFGTGVTKWDAADVTWTASGGDIGPATGAIIYSDTSTGDKLVCYIDFDGAKTAGDTTDLKIIFNASGIATITEV